MKPLIAITCLHDWAESRHRQNDTYIRSTQKAGGIPILVPCLENTNDILVHLNAVSGVIISGGPDADPRFFGEDPVPGLGAVNPAMDAYEIPLIREALRRDMPILGICRGEQLLNIAMGGSVIQHIPDSVKNPIKHRQDAPRHYRSHSISITSGTKLEAILGSGPILVNSYHHQAVRNLAPGFVTSALAPDGVIEAIESQQHSFAIGVQWHPECMWDHSDNYDSLFNAFIEAAAQYGSRQK